jgi:hypothetical protein
MHKRDIAALPLYAEKRASAAPAAAVLGLLQGHRRYEMRNEQGQTLYTFHDPLPEVAQKVIDLLGIDRAAYGLPAAPLAGWPTRSPSRPL